MKIFIKNGLLLLLFCINVFVSIAQPNKLTTNNAHAHNDYEHTRPFYQAFDAKFGSIEADVFPVNGQLLVAHNKKDVDTLRSLTTLYLIPIQKALTEHPNRKIQLLIDIKENAKESLSLLQKVLQPLMQWVSTPTKGNRLTIIISGDKPLPASFKDYPDYLFFDHHFDQPVPQNQLHRIGLISLPFYKYYFWDGIQPVIHAKAEKIKILTDSAHSLGKAIRFWAAPDTPLSWQLQQQCGIDYIGTDRIEAFSAWLKEEK